MRRLAPLLIWSLAFAMFASSAFAQSLKVVASISPVGDMVREVGGERVVVRVLLPPGASPHVFEPTPGTAKDISQATLFFGIGAGLDYWAEKLLKASKEHIRVILLSQGMRLLHEEEQGGHGHATANPHVWLDPLLAMEMVKKIEKTLAEADPQGAETYHTRGIRYLTKLQTLDTEIRDTVALFSIKSFVSFHPAWDYFALRYGLKNVGVIEESPGKEPSPQRLQAIVKAIRQYHIKAVFAEPQLNPKIAEVIAHEAGVKVILLDPEGGLPGRDTYLGLMRYNLSQLKEAMQ
ncbi:MAG TPA: metal ABC transporter substrate-binding protein [Thermodesulfovibrionales bacterium]|nr:metal ABC transporter substrate-binding protein [Thermodesulfovibrionales bacterium]